jgi:RIP metalloprotease RseP
LLLTGKALQISRQTSILEAQKQVTDVISTIRQTPDGESVEVQVKRGTSVDGVVKSISIQPRRSADAASAVAAPQSIGVFLSPNMLKIEKIQSNDILIAMQLAWQYLSDIYMQTLNGILSVLGNFILGTGPPPGQSISGPIGLIKQGSNVVATKDWTAVLLFAAALSVNLGVINALPLPALDGGQLVFIIAEALSGRKVDQRFQEGITSLAVLFLLWVTVSAAIGDVGNILSGIL